MGKIMSRLLHAAARGARIQSQWRDAHTPTYQEWQTNNQFVFIDTMRHYRIHPDDEHLQYGPISTALREIAFTDDCAAVDLPYIEVALLREEGITTVPKSGFVFFFYSWPSSWPTRGCNDRI
jgi:hypothetical protein